MHRKQDGFINGSSVTILIGGLALGGLLIYGAQSGHELPLWPAIAVAVVNLIAAAKMVIDTRKARQQKNSTAGDGSSRTRLER